MVVVKVRNSTYYMHDELKNRWDAIKDGKLAKHDEDRVYVVDGREGSGKSLFTIQQAAYIDPTILDDEGGKVLPRICFSTEETLKAIRNTRSNKDETKCIIFDEAFRGISSKAALSRENKKLVTAMMEMRQFNLVLWIVSPSFFLLELYAAMLRSNALFHIIKEKKSRRRYFKAWGYSNKASMYQIGIRKGWGYPIYTKFRGNFFNTYPDGKDFEQRYRHKKAVSHVENLDDTSEDHRWMVQRDKLLVWAYENHAKSHSKLQNWLRGLGIEISSTQIGEIMLKYKKLREKEALEAKNPYMGG